MLRSYIRKNNSNIFDKFFNQSSIKEKVEKLYEIDKEIKNIESYIATSE